MECQNSSSSLRLETPRCTLAQASSDSPRCVGRSDMLVPSAAHPNIHPFPRSLAHCAETASAVHTLRLASWRFGSVPADGCCRAIHPSWSPALNLRMSADPQCQSGPETQWALSLLPCGTIQLRPIQYRQHRRDPPYRSNQCHEPPAPPTLPLPYSGLCTSPLRLRPLTTAAHTSRVSLPSSFDRQARCAS